MRPIPLATFVIALAAPARAEEALRDQLKDLDLDERWIYDDWPAARARAAREGKPIFALFR
jgi:hypothetical protein